MLIRDQARQKISLSGSADTIRETINIKVPAGLDTAANHYLCIRVRNVDGAWSLYELDTFKVKLLLHFPI